MYSNTSDGKMDVVLNNTATIFLVLLTSLQTFIGALANIFVIITFLVAKYLRRRSSDLLILNLAAADFILLTTFLPWLTYSLSQRGIDQEYYFIYESLNTFVQLAGGNTIFFIAIDRYIAITLPLQYKNLVTRKVIYIFVTLAWTLAVGIAALNFFAYSYNFHYEFLVFWISFQLLLMLVITLIYIVVFSTALRQGRIISKERRHFGIKAVHHQHLAFKITLNTFILVSLFYATFLPIIIYITHSSLVMKQRNMGQMATRCWIYAFSSLNSCINPFVYALRTKRFKKACYHIWCKNNIFNANDIELSSRENRDI